MKILFISDLHYELKYHKGVDESKAWDWLINLIDTHKPSLILSAGDWGSAITIDDFLELTAKVPVLTIYGNHENLDVLTNVFNVKLNRPILIRDGEVVNFNGIKISGINGIVNLSGKPKARVPRKKPEEYLRVAMRIPKNIDILILHEVPNLQEYKGKITYSVGAEVAYEAIMLIKPRIVLNGHLHISHYTATRIDSILYLRVDSSQSSRCYAVISLLESVVEVYRDRAVVKEILF